jgi:hypothetical protein
MSTEAINLGLDNKFFITNLKKFADIISQDKYTKYKFLLVHANTTTENFKSSLLSHKIHADNLDFISLDFYLARFHIDLTNELNSYSNYFTQINKLFLNKNQPRDKHFICLNHRPRWHRYANMLALIANGHHKKGFISFAGEEDGRVDAPTVDTLDYAKITIDKLENGYKSLDALATLSKITPLVLDKNPHQIQNELWGKEGTGHLGQALGIDKNNPTENYPFLSCYFEIVTETYFTDNNCSYITEKTLRPIISLRPFICVGTPHLLTKLREYGFKTFAPFINEDYDLIEDPISRMNALSKEIDRLCSMTIGQIHKLYSDVSETLEYNYLHYLNHFQSTLNNKIFVPLLNKLEFNRSNVECAHLHT